MNHKLRPGLYSVDIPGFVVTVENMTSAYGNSGWFVWLQKDGAHLRERNEIPFPTKREAVAYASTWAAEELSQS